MQHEFTIPKNPGTSFKKSPDLGYANLENPMNLSFEILPNGILSKDCSYSSINITLD